MALVLFAAMACSVEREPVVRNAPGSQIGEVDCEVGLLAIELRLGGAPVDGTLTLVHPDGTIDVLDCLVGACAFGLPIGTYEVTVTVGAESQTMDVTIDEDDRTACEECCEGEALLEALLFEF